MKWVGAPSILLSLPRVTIDTEDVVHLFRLRFVSHDPTGICFSYSVALVEAIITAAQSLRNSSSGTGKDHCLTYIFKELPPPPPTPPPISICLISPTFVHLISYKRLKRYEYL